MGQSDQTSNTFLRGVQVADSNGQVVFETICQGRYVSRATHFHLEICEDDSLTNELKTTRFAFHGILSNTVYTSNTEYDESDMTQETTNSEDSVFGDGYVDQLLEITGDPDSGYVGTILVGV